MNSSNDSMQVDEVPPVEQSREKVGCHLVGLLFCVLGFFLVCVGFEFLLEIPYRVVMGWFWFLTVQLPLIRLDWGAIFLGMIALIATGFLCRWLLGKVVPVRYESLHRHRTRVASLFPLVLLAIFGTGIGMIGAMHQLAWLSEKPMLENRFMEHYYLSDSRNSLRQNSLSVHNYLDANSGNLPPGIVYADSGEARHSFWTVLLPLVQRSDLYSEIDLKQAWDASENLPHFAEHVDAYQFPEPDYRDDDWETKRHSSGQELSLAHYAANSQLLIRNRQRRFDEINDGTAVTLMFGEVVRNFQPWGEPGHLRDPALGLNQHAHGFGSPWKSGDVQFVMADGSVHAISEKIDPKILARLANPNDGEEVEAFDF